MSTRDRCGLPVGHLGRECGGEVGIDHDEASPSTGGCHATHPVTDLMLRDSLAHGRDHTGEIDTKLLSAFETRVPAVYVQHIGEVDAGGRHRDLDLSRPRGDPIKSDEAKRLQITRGPNLEAHTLVIRRRDSTAPIVGAERTQVQTRPVPVILTPGRLVFLRARDQLASHILCGSVSIDIDVGHPQVRVFGTDDAHQTAQSGLFEVGDIAIHHRLCVAGHHKQPWRLTRQVHQFAGYPHQMPHLIGTLQDHPIGTALGARRGDHEHAVERTGLQLVIQKLQRRNTIGVRPPLDQRHLTLAYLERIDQLGRPRINALTGADQQPAARGTRDRLRQPLLLPLDRQQTVVQQLIALFVIGRSGAKSEASHGNQHRSRLIQQVDIGFHLIADHLGHSGVAVLGGACGFIGVQTAYALGQRQRVLAGFLDVRQRDDGLEARIQQCGMHDIAALLCANITRQGHLRQHRSDGLVPAVRRGQPLEGRAVLDSSLIERRPQVVAGLAMRVLGTQGGQVVGDRHIDITAIAQDRSRTLDDITLIVRFHHELEDVRGLRRGRRRYRRRLPQCQQLFKRNTLYRRAFTEYSGRRRQRHLAVRRARVHRDVPDLMIGDPRLAHGPYVRLPDVPLGFFGQPYMRAQQRVDRNGMRAVALLRLCGQIQQIGPARPAGQRHINQLACRIEHREVHGPAGRVQVTDEIAQAVRQFLLTTHTCQGHHRDIEATRGLFCRVHQQRVRSELTEHPIPVVQRRLHRSGETYRVTQIVHPVVGVHDRPFARVEGNRRVQRDNGCPRREVFERVGEIVQDRIDLR
ncbi:Uncharacterised protein [Mycobacteroides abscessus subsp. abscessus]|nr:Uncharacterised protein [Mycobacteroides abscessus subsp. abscessus]